jgi:N-acetylmuramoyl-L-alanine amidase CwlA
MTIKWVGSPNYTEGRQTKVDRIVLHWIVGTLSAADAVFKRKESAVSAHYAVGGTEIHQYVEEENTAWHAGKWEVNSRSIGIEHEGSPTLPISEKTYETSAVLIADICNRYELPINRTTIMEHRDVVSTECPGTLDTSKLIKLAKSCKDLLELDTEPSKDNLEQALSDLRKCTNLKTKYLNELNNTKDQFKRAKELSEEFEQRLNDKNSLLLEAQRETESYKEINKRLERQLVEKNSKINELESRIKAQLTREYSFKDWLNLFNRIRW